MRTLAEEFEAQGFDLQVTHRDEKTGVVVRKNPYVLRVVQAPDGGKSRYWERPVGSGNLFDKKGNPIGRWEKDPKSGKGRFIASAEHVEFTPPETDDQKLARSVVERDVRIAELEKELANIRNEGKRNGRS